MLLRTGLTGGIPAGQNIVRRGVVDFKNTLSALFKQVSISLSGFNLPVVESRRKQISDVGPGVYTGHETKPLKTIILFTFD